MRQRTLELTASAAICLTALTSAVAAQSDATGPETPVLTQAPAPPDAAASSLSSIVAQLPHDLSPWGMFLQADVVVKAVMVGLAFASFVTWTIWFAKGVELMRERSRARRSLAKLARSESLAEARAAMLDGGTRSSPVAHLLDAAVREQGRSADLDSEGVKERVAIALARREADAGRRMALGTGLLATIGATAPFVGLFGTVWGIMNAFIGISRTKTTNLAVVAPGIAEALLATAIGLVAAIPAVIIYNVFARALTNYRALLSDASGEILQHLSRDLDRADKAHAVPSRREAFAPSAGE